MLLYAVIIVRSELPLLTLYLHLFPKICLDPRVWRTRSLSFSCLPQPSHSPFAWVHVRKCPNDRQADNGLSSLLSFQGLLNVQEVCCFVDPGSEVTLISEAFTAFIQLYKTPASTTIKGVGGGKTLVAEQVALSLFMGGRSHFGPALVSPQAPVGDILLGLAWCRHHKVVLDYVRKKLRFGIKELTVHAFLNDATELKASPTGTVAAALLVKYKAFCGTNWPSSAPQV